MIRYMFALWGEPGDGHSAISITETTVDIFNDGQIQEWYLCDINPKGQVPALTSPILDEAITETMDITRFICKRYPQLAPLPHTEQVMKFLDELHDISYFSLTFCNKQHVPRGMVEKLKCMIEDSQYPERYREALKHKLDLVERDKLPKLESGVPEHNLERSRTLLRTFDDLLQPEAGPWLWGLTKPTALDAHLVPFIARLCDLGHGDAVSSSMKTYAETAMAGSEWNHVMQGRRTFPK